MSKREDIIDPIAYKFDSGIRNGLIYTENLGWIDLGHARGDDIINTLNLMSVGEASASSYYLIRYEQTMSYGRISTGRYVRWNIKRGRSLSERHSIMLAMLMQTARAFENWQDMSFFSWFTDSGFSGEELVSDLLGFYKAIRPGNYWNFLKPVSREAALRRWDYYGPIGSFKNRGFRPLLFPDPLNKTSRHVPYKGQLPQFMTTVTPFNDFNSGIVQVIDRASVVNKFGGVTLD
ncbi:hypothetical protein PMPD1_3964 [Paramixta manurensis]|uniref:DUF4056 domain-containing protein n=1 Tax=Paramixta manurensis TaxID=2740817 RepID=A0A6M8UUS8_9GAMM|nr:hypothetical protein PMPD1_3964 [Erwiniaceae bacterium PD-1]